MSQTFMLFCKWFEPWGKSLFCDYRLGEGSPEKDYNQKR